MAENADDLLKRNKQKLETYRAHGFKEIALTCRSREHPEHKCPKKIITLDEAERDLKKLSKDGYSFLAVG